MFKKENSNNLFIFWEKNCLKNHCLMSAALLFFAVSLKERGIWYVMAPKVGANSSVRLQKSLENWWMSLFLKVIESLWVGNRHVLHYSLFFCKNIKHGLKVSSQLFLSILFPQHTPTSLLLVFFLNLFFIPSSA